MYSARHLSRGETRSHQWGWDYDRERMHTREATETSEETRLGEETSVDLLVCSKGKIEGLTNTMDLIRLKILC